ncbi:MAG: histidine phosphatase family protein [Acidimicrobiia bacterium]|nr:histidine phosphatase family protein [Acidimicrobiia bacterium]
MLRLMLFRHGKSDWNTTTRGDRDRPLSSRGERSAETMGLVLRKMGEIPDLVVSSPAVRAETTAALARISGGWGSRLEIADELYGAGPETALAVAARCGKDTERLMLVGHEPTWSLLAERITGGRIEVKTGTVLAFDLNAATWTNVGRASGSLAFAVHPRMFDGGEWDLP